MKSIRLSACAALLLLASCAMTGVPAFAVTARVTVDVGTKDILSTNTLSLGENALVLVRNLGDSHPSDIFVSLHDRRSGEILAGASNFVADVQTSVWTNWSWGETSSVPTIVSRTVTNALGYLPLDTTNLFSRFVGLPVTAERSFILSVYDTANRWVLGQDDISVRNSAVYGYLTNSAPSPTPANFATIPQVLNWDQDLDESLRSLISVTSSNLQDHITNTNNPHHVTLDQLSANDEMRALLARYGIHAASYEGVMSISWPDHLIDFENGAFHGPWLFSSVPAVDGHYLATTNYVGLAIRDVAESLDESFDYLSSSLRLVSNSITPSILSAFTNGTAPALIPASFSYSRFIDGYDLFPGLFFFGDPYNQLTLKPAGAHSTYLTLSTNAAQVSRDFLVGGDVNASSYTLHGERIGSWSDIAMYASNATIHIQTGVSSLNNLSNNVTLAAGTNVSLRTSGQTIFVDSLGSGGGGADTNAIKSAFTNGWADAIAFGAGLPISEYQHAHFVSIPGLFYVIDDSIHQFDPGAPIFTNLYLQLDEETYLSVGQGGFTFYGQPSFDGPISWNGQIRNSWSDIGGGGTAWSPASRVTAAPSNTVLASDYLIWMDSETAATNQVLNLPDMTNAAFTVVVRHLGSDHPSIIRRGNSTYQLAGDGASVAIDWLAAKTNWYWRQAY